MRGRQNTNSTQCGLFSKIKPYCFIFFYCLLPPLKKIILHVIIKRYKEGIVNKKITLILYYFCKLVDIVYYFTENSTHYILFHDPEPQPETTTQN